MLPVATMARRGSLAERLSEKVDRSAGADACWPFTGFVIDTGYGRIWSGLPSGPLSIGAHRAAYLVAHPGEPAPEMVDHACHDPAVCEGGNTCPHRRCCNPAHLVASTAALNGAPHRMRTLVHERDTCAAGHPYDAENTYRTRAGYRSCRECSRSRWRARYRRRKESLR